MSQWHCVVAGPRAAARNRIGTCNWDSLDASAPEEPPRPIVSGRAESTPNNVGCEPSANRFRAQRVRL